MIRTLLAAVGLSRGIAAPSSDSQNNFNPAAFLRAIAQVESGENPHAVGPLGERSMYQFTRDTWRLHSLRSIYDATTDPAYAHQIALRHLAYLHSVLRAQAVPETPATLAAAWHYGPRFAKICTETDYVRRVGNLYREFAR